MAERVQRAIAFGSVPVCLVLMLMVMGNTQASVAPLTMTMLLPPASPWASAKCSFRSRKSWSSFSSRAVSGT